METSTIVRKQTAKKQPTVKSRFYKWHRILGITALVPVMFWTISGLSHPFMSNWFRPFIPQEVFRPLSQQEMAPRLSIQQVMDANRIKQLRNFSLVNFDKGTYYQILKADSSYSYYSANDARLLLDGDRLYAIYLARYFTQDSVSALKQVVLQKTFDGDYQPINHLLPVWKVSFNRPDGMDIYVETSQSRLGTFNNNTRKTFLWIFRQFHNWQFLADLGGEQFRISVLLIVITLLFLSLLSGITVYGLFWKRFKEISKKRKADNRDDKRFVHRFHRQLGLIVSFVMFTFVVSGGFHLWVKLHNLQTSNAAFAQLINRQDLKINNLQTAVPDSTISRLSVVRFNNHVYYQILNTQKQMQYVDAASGVVNLKGDQEFAVYLSNFYKNKVAANQSEIPVKVIPIIQFTEEYGFINKRLPVEQVSYTHQNDYYVETSSAKLAAHVAGIDRTEGFSFIFLHKYFGMTWAGKNIRDLVSMLAAAGVLVVSLFGMAAFIKNT